MARAVRAFFLFGGGVAAWWLTRADSWAVFFIMWAPAVRLAMLGVRWRAAAPAEANDGRRTPAMEAGVFLIAVLVGAGAAIAFHVAMANLLQGHIRPAEVVWSAWFYTGCIHLLEGLDALATRALGRLRPAALRKGLRLAVLLLVVPPAAAALLQVVRVKVGYEMAPDARLLDPAEFQTRTADGVAIHGYFFDRGHNVTVVAAHGIGAHAENFLPYLTPLVRDHDVNGLIFDFRAHGYSEGHTSSVGYHEVRDVLAAVDWLRAEHPEAAERLIIYGFSMGSAAAVAAAERTPETIGIILDSGFARLTEIAWTIAEQLPPVFGPYVYYTGLPVASLVAEAPLWRLRPADTLARLGVPIWVMHGSDDAIIPSDQARTILDQPGAEGLVVPGGQHVNLPDADPAYFTHVGRFIDHLIEREE